MKKEKQEIEKVKQEIQVVEIDETTIEQAKRRWELYKKLENILEDDDYIWYVFKDGGRLKSDGTKEDAERLAKKVGGEIKRYKKKSAFRKLAKFLSISLPAELNEIKTEKTEMIGKWILTIERGQGVEIKTWYDGETLQVQKCEVSCIVKTTDGKTFCGVAGADKNERGWSKEQDIRATAYTRALNRAISDAIGLGEVSAEELSEESIEVETKNKDELKIKKKIIIDDAGQVQVVEKGAEEKKVEEKIIDKLRKLYKEIVKVKPDFEKTFENYVKFVYDVNIDEIQNLPEGKQVEILQELEEYKKKIAKGG